MRTSIGAKEWGPVEKKVGQRRGRQDLCPTDPAPLRFTTEFALLGSLSDHGRLLVPFTRPKKHTVALRKTDIILRYICLKMPLRLPIVSFWQRERWGIASHIGIFHTGKRQACTSRNVE